MTPHGITRLRAIARAALDLGLYALAHRLLDAADEESLHSVECMAAACEHVGLVARDQRVGVETIGRLLAQLIADELRGDCGADEPVPYSLTGAVAS